MRTTILLVIALLVIGCETPGRGVGTAGIDPSSSALGVQGAQTIGGSQGIGETPQTTTGGIADNDWWFASQNTSEVQMELLRLAAEKGWTADQVVNALRATNGAPDNVTITTGNITTQGGSADATGATSGTGGGGQVTPTPTNP